MVREASIFDGVAENRRDAGGAFALIVAALKISALAGPVN